MLSFSMVVFLLIGILFMGLPVAFSLGGTSLLLIALFDLPMKIVGATIFTSLDSFTILSIPLFVLMSQVLLDGRIGDDLFDVMNAWVRHLPGGLAIATILACAFFAAITGSGAATAATIGMVAYPAMIERGYDKKFTLGLLAAGGTLGILIPPSIPMVVYGAATDTSIGALLLSGIGPGVLFGILIILYGYWYSGKKGYGSSTKFEWSKVFTSTRKATWALLTPVIIVGGIYSGIFTPTEAAAVAAVYSLIVGLFIYRTLKLRDLPEIFLKSSITSATIMFVVGGVVLFGWVLVREQIPQTFTRVILDNISSPLMFLVVTNLIILVAGMLMDPSPAIILFAPLLLPAVHAFGISPIFFGALMVTNLAIGLVTPPVALTLYVAAEICQVSLSRLIKRVMPIVVLLVIGLFLVTFIPDIAMFIPRLLMGVR